MSRSTSVNVTAKLREVPREMYMGIFAAGEVRRNQSFSRRKQETPEKSTSVEKASTSTRVHGASCRSQIFLHSISEPSSSRMTPKMPAKNGVRLTASGGSRSVGL